MTESVETAISEPRSEIAEAPGGLPAVVEAILMVIEEPITETALAASLDVPISDISEAVAQLQKEYDGEADRPARGFELRQLAGGWRIYSRQSLAPWVQQFLLEGQRARLSQAALETLAVVAYRQPVSRARISAIRGVNVDSVVRTLALRGFIEEASTESDTGAVLYGTTGYFLEKLGLNSIEELPQIAPLLPGVEDLDEFQD